MRRKSPTTAQGGAVRVILDARASGIRVPHGGVLLLSPPGRQGATQPAPIRGFTGTWGESNVLALFEMSHVVSDSELLACAQAGDEHALDLLIASLRPRVVRYCRSRLSTYAGGWDAADDAAQETCAAVVQVLPTYRHQGPPFITFVYAIAARKVADIQRRLGRSAICIDHVPEQTEPSPTPEEQAVAAAARSSVMGLVDQLPERTREILLLRASGASADVVGHQLGMTANAVRVCQHRGLSRLRHLIERSEEHRDLFESLLTDSHHTN
jgi:RNA polymerase sigma-70 factor (ECF subfamily)